MKAPIAVLCDAVSVREGLLHILGAGVTKVGRPSVPTPFGVNLALLLAFDQDELGPHRISITMTDANGAELGSIAGEIEANTTSVQDSELPLLAPLAVPLDAVPLPEWGVYQVEVRVDDHSVAVLPVKLMPLDNLRGEPGDSSGT
jgi:hypothetical protein